MGVKTNMKNTKAKKINLTKRNLLLWKKDIMITTSIAMITIVYSMVIIIIIAKLLLHDSLSFIFDTSFLMVLLMPLVIIVFVGVILIIIQLQCLKWLHREELYLDIQFNDILGNVSIHRTDNCYITDEWFIIPSRAYAFHIDFIINIGKFKYHTYHSCGYDGKLFTADGDTWKIYNISNSEYKKLKKWFNQGKIKNV